MADIFHEVDEEVRREQLKKLWERYGLLLIGLAFLIVVGVGVWRGYEWWIEKKVFAAGAQFEAAVALSEQGKHTEAQALFDKIATDAPQGYRVLSRFRAAAEQVQSNPAEAVKSFDIIAADNSLGPLWQELAQIRASVLLVDSTSFDAMKKRLDPLATTTGIYRHSARELLALSAWRDHNNSAAKHYLDIIAGDPETPPGTRARADVLSALIASHDKS